MLLTVDYNTRTEPLVLVLLLKNLLKNYLSFFIFVAAVLVLTSSSVEEFILVLINMDVL